MSPLSGERVVIQNSLSSLGHKPGHLQGCKQAVVVQATLYTDKAKF